MNPTGPRPESEARLKPFVDAATAAIRRFDFAGAEKQYSAAIEEAERLDPSDPVALAHVLEALATLGAMNERIGAVAVRGSTRGAVGAVEAEALRERARRLLEDALGPDSPEMAEHLASEATTLIIRGRPDEAEDRLQRAMAIVDKEPDENGRRLVAILSQMAFLRMQSGRLIDAEPLLQRAVEVAGTLTDQPDDNIAPPSMQPSGPVALAGALNLLAMLHNQQRRHRDAEREARQAVALCEPLSEQPSQLSASYNTLAMALRHQGKLKEGWQFYRRHLALDREKWAEWGWLMRLTMTAASAGMFVLGVRVKATGFGKR